MVLLSFTLLMELGSGRTIIVDDDGEGDFTTIQEAINKSVEGDVIRVYNGTYNESLIVNVSVSIIGNGSDGVRINGIEDTNTIRITANGTMIDGLYVRRSGKSYAMVVFSQGNVLNNISCSGNILFEDSNNNTIRSIQTSIDLRQSNYNLINNFSATIDLIDSYFNVIENSSDPNWGIISLIDSSNNFIQNNVLRRIRLTHSNNNSLTNNTTSGNTFGIKLIDSKNNTLRRNVMINFGFIIEGRKVEYWASHNIDTTNILYNDYTSTESRILYYYANENGVKVPGNRVQVILANCTNMIVTDQNCSDVGTGISLAYSSHNYIAQNNCSSNWEDGIYLWESNFNRIIGNTCYNNVYGAGIMLWLSSNNVITNNVLSGQQHYNIFIHSSNNTFLINN